MSSEATEALLERALGGDCGALAELFEQHRDRLERMVRLRLDRRLQGRLDPADVLQEAYLDVARRFPEYRADPAVPFFLWLRLLTGQRLIDLHRRHLGAKMRDAGLEISLHHGRFPQASSASLAELLMGRLTTASRAAIRTETQRRVQEALNAMDPIDREVLVLRHFEMLSNEETAQLLGLKHSAASNRHMRALKGRQKGGKEWQASHVVRYSPRPGAREGVHLEMRWNYYGDRFRAWPAETDCGGVARTVVRPGGCAARASSEPEALATVFLLRCKR